MQAKGLISAKMTAQTLINIQSRSASDFRKLIVPKHAYGIPAVCFLPNDNN
jgi:hypothetical protein